MPDTEIIYDLKRGGLLYIPCGLNHQRCINMGGNGSTIRSCYKINPPEAQLVSVQRLYRRLGFGG
jgi:hypothetical protein